MLGPSSSCHLLCRLAQEMLELTRQLGPRQDDKRDNLFCMCFGYAPRHAGCAANYVHENSVASCTTATACRRLLAHVNADAQRP